MSSASTSINYFPYQQDNVNLYHQSANSSNQTQKDAVDEQIVQNGDLKRDLIQAAVSGNFEKLKTLIPKSPSLYIDEAFYEAMKKSKTRSVRLLVRAGANIKPKSKPKGFTYHPLLEAAYKWQWRILIILLETGISPSTRYPSTKYPNNPYVYHSPIVCAFRGLKNNTDIDKTEFTTTLSVLVSYGASDMEFKLKALQMITFDEIADVNKQAIIIINNRSKIIFESLLSLTPICKDICGVIADYSTPQNFSFLKKFSKELD
jgi:hypothetical protein